MRLLDSGFRSVWRLRAILENFGIGYVVLGGLCPSFNKVCIHRPAKNSHWDGCGPLTVNTELSGVSDKTCRHLVCVEQGTILPWQSLPEARGSFNFPPKELCLYLETISSSI